MEERKRRARNGYQQCRRHGRAAQRRPGVPQAKRFAAKEAKDSFGRIFTADPEWLRLFLVGKRNDAEACRRLKRME